MHEVQVRRYARHILLADVGGVGQKRLLAARVAVADAGGAASAALVYLAAAGIGTLVVADEGAVGAADVGFLYLPEDIGRPRRQALAARVAELNPDVQVVAGDQAEHRLEVRAADVLDALAEGAAAAGELVRTIARTP